MADSKIDIAYVAQLARLELDPAQAEKLQGELGNIVRYIDKLAELDVTGVEPTAHAISRRNVWREDEVRDSFPRETMLANAPDLVDETLIKVPQVLPGEGSN
ncbi:MAG: Asp-tRNA(Asn)/Glu-tRNA(Gln) amidotransferase subunit GatC [Victivallaceae bacterium]|nr:Asp-tRNA(Asn)/Glu-tRNA(Gln) amidotransferase subunit GatC [Victivallaceae bacterium]